jgi:cation diffusion facilitator CzcD-associated flavoprotein CzcO
LPGAEIQAYFESVARRHGVDTHIRFGAEIARCGFSGGRWQLGTKSGQRDQADVVIAATGVLHHPKLLDIAGRDTFAGACFRSARWDHGVRFDDRGIPAVWPWTSDHFREEIAAPKVEAYDCIS